MCNQYNRIMGHFPELMNDSQKKSKQDTSDTKWLLQDVPQNTIYISAVHVTLSLYAIKFQTVDNFKQRNGGKNFKSFVVTYFRERPRSISKHKQERQCPGTQQCYQLPINKNTRQNLPQQ